MTSPLVPALADELNLGGPAIQNVMTLGQLKLLARCVNAALLNRNFHQSLSEDELEEAGYLAAMFEDPELEQSDRDTLHGFCL